jgi:hypothetical protein
MITHHNLITWPSASSDVLIFFASCDRRLVWAAHTVSPVRKMLLCETERPQAPLVSREMSTSERDKKSDRQKVMEDKHCHVFKHGPPFGALPPLISERFPSLSRAVLFEIENCTTPTETSSFKFQRNECGHTGEVHRVELRCGREHRS